MIAVKLSCGHRVALPSDLMPTLQYPDDEHYVWCPTCRLLKERYHFINHTSSVMGWNEIVGVYPVSSGLPQVMPQDVMRVQPRKRGTPRVRPFPYVRGRQGQR